MNISHFQPIYHFTAPEKLHWPFDPNGFIFHNGRYHAFYLFQEEGILDGKTSWGHASTVDFIHWHYHPVALECDLEHERSIFSGCILMDKTGCPVILYNSVGEGICLATSLDDDLIHWRKSSANPVIKLPKEGSPEDWVYNVGDPHAWLDEDGRYYVILAATARPYREYETTYLFRSDDLVNWEYLRPFYEPSEHFTKIYDDCACPDFFKIGGKYALFCISHARGGRYYLGDYAMHTFVPRSHHWLNWGGGVFAPKTWIDNKGRRIVCLWHINKTMDCPATQYMECWTMPRELKLADDGSCLLQFVPDEFKSLYGKPEHIRLPDGWDGGRFMLPVQSRCCKLELSLRLKTGLCILQLLSNENGTECMELLIDRELDLLVMDVAKSGIPFKRTPYISNFNHAPEYEVTPGQTMPFNPGPGGCYDLDIYLDNSMVEVFSKDGRFACAQSVLNGPDCNRIAVSFTKDSRAEIKSLVFIPMAVKK